MRLASIRKRAPPTSSHRECSRFHRSFLNPRSKPGIWRSTKRCRGVRIGPVVRSADWSIPFEVKSGGDYDVFAREQSLLFALDRRRRFRSTTELHSTEWGRLVAVGQVTLSAGRHAVSDGYIDQDLDVALVRADDLEDGKRESRRCSGRFRKILAFAKWVYGLKTKRTLPSSGRYRVEATAVGPFGPDVLAAMHLDKRASSHGAFQRISQTLPYVVDAGVAATSAILMPDSWYREDPACTVAARRPANPGCSSLARRTCVSSFPERGTSSRVAMKVSRLQIGSVLTVAVNGGVQRTLALPGGNAGAQEYDTIDRLTGPAPVAVTADLTLGRAGTTWRSSLHRLPVSAAI